MESKIHLSRPPNYNQPTFESNAIYYRSKTTNTESIILIQSHSFTQQICKYQIQDDKFSTIPPRNTPSSPSIIPFKAPKLAQIITHKQQQLLTLINTKNQICAMDLDTFQYFDNYQATHHHHHSYTSSYLSYISTFILLFALFLCNNSITIASTYTVLLWFTAIYVSNFTHSFEKDVKCTIPHFERLYNIQSYAVDDHGIYFVANEYEDDEYLICFKFDIKSRQFITLKPIDICFNDGETSHIMAAYKIVYIPSMETLIMFTNTPNVYYFDLEKNSEWRLFEDMQLPKVPGSDYHMNVVVAFHGIVFLFFTEYMSYSPKHAKKGGKRILDEDGLPEIDSDDEEDEGEDDEECLSYCWDLIFSGELFQSDNDYDDIFNKDEQYMVINTDKNWCHFIGENSIKPTHFKISLADEIPAALSITHLQVYHSLIKQYIMECMKKKLSSDIEMIILDYFPMFL